LYSFHWVLMVVSMNEGIVFVLDSLRKPADDLKLMTDLLKE
jgi:hypothetical protein